MSAKIESPGARRNRRLILLLSAGALVMLIGGGLVIVAECDAHHALAEQLFDQRSPAIETNRRN